MKWNIALGIAGIVATVAGTVYTQWPGTDPNISSAWVSVSADTVTLGLVMLGAATLSILLILASRPLWPAVRERLKTRRQRFKELAPELRELQQMTLVSGVIPTQHTMPSVEHRTRALLLVMSLARLGIDCSPAINIDWDPYTWRTLEECFEALAVLADAGRLDTAKIAAESFRGEIRDQIRERAGI